VCRLTFLVVGNQGLGNSLSDSVDLGNMTTALDFDSDINTSKTVLAQKENGFVEFVLEETGFNDGQWSAIHFNEPMAAFAVRNSRGGFFAAENLDRLDWLLSSGSILWNRLFKWN